MSHLQLYRFICSCLCFLTGSSFFSLYICLTFFENDSKKSCLGSLALLCLGGFVFEKCPSSKTQSKFKGLCCAVSNPSIASLLLCRTSSPSTRSVTSRVQPRTRRTCARSPTSPRTCRPATTTATCSARSTW